MNEGIVECSWGGWDGDNINLYITGLKTGTTTILIFNDVYDVSEDMLEIKVTATFHNIKKLTSAEQTATEIFSSVAVK